MDSLKDLNSAALLVMGVVMILREIFGFLKRPHREGHSQAEILGLSKVLESVSVNIQTQTSLMKDFMYEMKIFAKDLGDIKYEIKRNSSGQQRANLPT